MTELSEELRNRLKTEFNKVSGKALHRVKQIEDASLGNVICIPVLLENVLDYAVYDKEQGKFTKLYVTVWIDEVMGVAENKEILL